MISRIARKLHESEDKKQNTVKELVSLYKEAKASGVDAPLAAFRDGISNLNVAEEGYEIEEAIHQLDDAADEISEAGFPELAELISDAVASVRQRKQESVVRKACRASRRVVRESENAYAYDDFSDPETFSDNLSDAMSSGWAQYVEDLPDGFSLRISDGDDTYGATVTRSDENELRLDVLSDLDDGTDEATMFIDENTTYEEIDDFLTSAFVG